MVWPTPSRHLSVSLRAGAFAALAAASWQRPQEPPAAPPAPAARAASGRVILRADAAWVDPQTRISPAYIVVADGRIESVQSTEPRGPGKRVEVRGTLAPAIVDAWSGLVPEDLLQDGHPTALHRVGDALPVDSPGADPELAARVAAAFQAGIGAAWLSGGAGILQRGLGTPARFSGSDLPVATGFEALEVSLGSARLSGPAALLDAEKLAELFESAEALRDAREEYKEKLEQYRKDLEEYQKKLDEYARKKQEQEEKGKEEEKKEKPAGEKQGGPQGGGGGRSAMEPGGQTAPPEDGWQRGQRRAQEGGPPPQEAKPDEARKKEEEKKEGPPKRPARPKEPDRNPALDLVLRVMDRELAVRADANSAADIEKLLALRERYGFDLVIAGGDEAHLLAERLADAEVPVVLPVSAPGSGPPEVRLAQRYQELRRAGVRVALASGGSDAGAVLLLLRAGELVAAGSDPEDVWASLTSVPAEILGVEAGLGRLRPGADAVFLSFEGRSPFDASAPSRGFRP